MSGWRVDANDGDAPTADERAEVDRELTLLQRFARSLRLDEVRDGTWFSRLLKYSLDSYTRQVDASYFATQYPGLSPDALVAARIQRAARQAMIEGGVSAGAYTGTVAATLGSAGTASPLTVPAAATSFVVDLLFVSSLQLRLAYDIAVIHRVPLDLDNAEDLWRLIQIAFVIKGGEAGRGVVAKGVPMAVRPVINKLYGGGALAAARSIPAVGGYLLRRNLIKFSVPAVGVPLSMAINYWSLRTAGAHAEKVFTSDGRVIAAAREVAASTEARAAVLWVLWLVIKADGLTHESERLLLRHVTAILDDPESELAALAELAYTPDPNSTQVWLLLGATRGDRAPLYRAGVLAAAIDGKINVNELAVLRRLAEQCGVAYDEAAVRALATTYARRA